MGTISAKRSGRREALTGRMFQWTNRKLNFLQRGRQQPSINDEFPTGAKRMLSTVQNNIWKDIRFSAFPIWPRNIAPTKSTSIGASGCLAVSGFRSQLVPLRQASTLQRNMWYPPCFWLCSGSMSHSPPVPEQRETHLLGPKNT